MLLAMTAVLPCILMLCRGLTCNFLPCPAGLTTSQIDDVDTTLMAVPAVGVKTRCLVEGEDPGAEILEQDFVTLNVWTVLTRLAHMSSGGLGHGAGLRVMTP